MSILSGVLEGGKTFELTGNFWLPIPPHAMNVALREPGGVETPKTTQMFEKVTLGVWPKKQIITVHADGAQRGWLSVPKLRKSRLVDVNNVMYGIPPLKLSLPVDLHEQIQVWLDQMEERGQIPSKAPLKLSEQELVRMDPRVDEMHQEHDGFCDTSEGWDRRAPPRAAWWVYIVRTWYNDNMGGQTIHECNLKTVLEHLKDYVHPASPEEMAENE